MKKVALVIRLFQDNCFYGGGEKFLYKLINEFVKNNYIIDIWCNESTVTEFPGINEIIICNEDTDLSTPQLVEKYYEKIKKRTAEKQYNYIISDSITPKIDMALLQIHSLVHRRFNKKNLIQYYYYKYFKPAKLDSVYYEEKWAKQDHRKIFVVSNKIKRDLIKNFKVDENRISVIYPGVDPIEKLEEKEKNDIFTFGISATFFKRKGGLIFLAALRILKSKKCKFKAIMILRNTKSSKTRWLKLLLKIFNISDEVEFISYQNPMSDFYKKLDCLVMPSVEEAFGLVALEAMINKLPCIVSSCSGVSEIIEDGESGFIFDIKNNASKNLAHKMSKIIKNPEKVEKCINNAHKIAQKYSWQKTFADLEKCLKVAEMAEPQP